jgi:hypothetical protein
MTITLDLPPHVEQAYQAAAQSKGVFVDALILDVIIAGKPIGKPQTQSQTVFEQEQGLLASEEDAASLDEDAVVTVAYEERRRAATTRS